MLVGIFSIVKLIRKALENFRAQTIFLIVGLMIGSIYAVIMGPTTLDTPQPAMSIQDFSILFFIIGGGVIPSTPVIQHQNTAPAPPIAIAVEIPMIFPVPIVAASAVASAV